MISILLFAASAIQPAGEALPVSPTAVEMSKVVVAGAKAGLSSSGAYQPSCIAAIPNEAATQAVQEHVIAKLSKAEAEYLDAFFGSELGRRFNANSIAAQDAANESRPYTQVSFTLAEAQHAGTITHSAAATKLFAAINSTGGPFIEAIDAMILPLASQCRVAP